MRNVATYLRISHQRLTQMYAEGKLPEPDNVDGVGPQWEPATIERWAEREWGGRGVGEQGLESRARVGSMAAVARRQAGGKDDQGPGRRHALSPPDLGWL